MTDKNFVTVYTVFNPSNRGNLLLILGAVHKRRRNFLGGEGGLKLRCEGARGHRKYDVEIFLR